MLHFRFEHDFDVDAKDYWELFLGEEFTVDLFARLNLKDRQLIERTDDGTTLKRVQRATPANDLPGFLKSIVSDTSYTEHDVYRRDRSEMEVVIVPAMMKSKFDMKGLYSVKPLGDGKCRRIFEGDVKVSVMLIGGQIEKYMVDEMRVSYDTAARVTREWIARGKPKG